MINEKYQIIYDLIPFLSSKALEEISLERKALLLFFKVWLLNKHFIGGIMNKTIALYVAGTVFALVALLHLWRLATGTLILVGGTLLPIWPSWVGIIVSAALSIWMFASACCCGSKSCTMK